MKAPIISLAAAMVFQSAIASASPIQITSYSRETSAGFDFLYDATLDSSGPETSIQTDGGISNETTVAHQSGSTLDSFSFLMTHELATPSAFDSVLTTILVEFTTLEDATYAIEGIYSMLAAEGTLMVASAYLTDLTEGQDLFLKSAESANTLNETLILTNPDDGDFDNVFFGTPTGNLFAGHQYWFELTYGMYSLGPVAVGSTANGEATFTVQSVAAVPEPASLALAFLAMAGMRIGRKRQYSRK